MNVEIKDRVFTQVDQRIQEYQIMLWQFTELDWGWQMLYLDFCWAKLNQRMLSSTPLPNLETIATHTRARPMGQHN
jgi:hypothetical protein